jgi:hypothetical protein
MHARKAPPAPWRRHLRSPSPNPLQAPAATDTSEHEQKYHEWKSGEPPLIVLPMLIDSCLYGARIGWLGRWVPTPSGDIVGTQRGLVAIRGDKSP